MRLCVCCVNSRRGILSGVTASTLPRFHASPGGAVAIVAVVDSVCTIGARVWTVAAGYVCPI